MRPPKEKWAKLAAAMEATSRAVSAVADAAMDAKLGPLAGLVPRADVNIGDLVTTMQTAVAELVAHVDSSEECEMD